MHSCILLRKCGYILSERKATKIQMVYQDDKNAFAHWAKGKICWNHSPYEKNAVDLDYKNAFAHLTEIK